MALDHRDGRRLKSRATTKQKERKSKESNNKEKSQEVEEDPMSDAASDVSQTRHPSHYFECKKVCLRLSFRCELWLPSTFLSFLVMMYVLCVVCGICLKFVCAYFIAV